MNQSNPDFVSAAVGFQKFLRDADYPEEIIWVTAKDVLWMAKGFMYVRVPVPATNELEARRVYDEG